MRDETAPEREPVIELTAEEQAMGLRAKAVLRKRVRALRGSLPEAAVRGRSAEIVKRLDAMPEMQAARAVALFWPIEARREVDVRALDAALRARGARVAYPAIEHDTREMTFRFASEADLEERGLGFAEPAQDAEHAALLDVIVVPALQIDAAGHRLGYGAGFYDRAIPRYAPPAITVGVIYDFQLAVDLPRTERDVPVQWIVTEARTLRASGEATGAP